jgi:methionyl-tRNA formyltransferase
MRIVFAGTPAPAVPSLRAVAASAHDLVGVDPSDAPLGRKRVLTPSPVAAGRRPLGVPIIKADRLDAEATAAIDALARSRRHRRVRRPRTRTAPVDAAHGWINLHFSLLPRWRGAAPVQHALIAGDRTTGASVFQLVAALDAGDVFGDVRLRHPARRDGGRGSRRTSRMRRRAAGPRDRRDRGGDARAVPQRHADARAEAVDRRRRARPHRPADVVLDRFAARRPSPAPRASPAPPQGLAAHRGPTPTCRRGRSPPRDATCCWRGEGTTVVLKTVQPSGKGAMAAGDWWRGLRIDDPRVELPSDAGDLVSASPRWVAYDVLRAVHETDAYANLLLPRAIARPGSPGRMPARDRADLRDPSPLGTYDAIIADAARRPVADIDPAVRDALRLGCTSSSRCARRRTPR